MRHVWFDFILLWMREWNNRISLISITLKFKLLQLELADNQSQKLINNVEKFNVFRLIETEIGIRKWPENIRIALILVFLNRLTSLYVYGVLPSWILF